MYLATADNQFGFKKNIGRNHAIFSVRILVERATKEGNIINLCAIDLPKAFDKANHHALYIKLTKSLIPVELLELLEKWLSNCMTSVKWQDVFSPMFMITFGARQGSVLSPYLFAVYLDDLYKLYKGTRSLSVCR